MTDPSFEEASLVSNRVSVMLFGGMEEDRRRWALEVAAQFPEDGPLVEVKTPEELQEALGRTRSVVYLPDVLKLGDASQRALALNLFTQEERPKWIVGVVGAPEAARIRGALREDLHYRLRRAHVDLSDAALREQIDARRAGATEPTSAPASAPATSRERPSRAPSARSLRGGEKVAASVSRR